MEQNGGDSSWEYFLESRQINFHYERLIGGKSSPVGLDNNGIAIT